MSRGTFLSVRQSITRYGSNILVGAIAGELFISAKLFNFVVSFY